MFLVEDVLVLCELYDVVDGEEIGFVFDLCNQCQFGFDLCCYFFWNFVWIMFGQIFVGFLVQVVVWCYVFGNDFLWVFVV